jgi:uncharacterized coiled-coil protein SlyX
MRLLGWFRKKPLVVDLTRAELEVFGCQLAQMQGAFQEVARELKATTSSFSEDMRTGRQYWNTVVKRLDELGARNDLGDVHVHVAYNSPAMAARIVDGFMEPPPNADAKDGVTNTVDTLIDLLLDEEQTWADSAQEKMVRTVFARATESQVKTLLSRIGDEVLCDDSIAAIVEYCEEDAKERAGVAFHLLVSDIHFDDDRFDQLVEVLKDSESVRHMLALLESDEITLDESTVDELAAVVAEHGTDVDRARFLKNARYDLSDEAQETLTEAFEDV